MDDYIEMTENSLATVNFLGNVKNKISETFALEMAQKQKGKKKDRNKKNKNK